MTHKLFALICLSLIVLMPACHKKDTTSKKGETTMKTQKKSEKKTHTKKKTNGGMVEETVTRKSEMVTK